MKINEFIFIAIFFLLHQFYSCSSVNSRDEKIKRVKNDSGELGLLPYVIIGGDTLIDGKAAYYFRNGKIKDEIEFKKGIKNGWDRHYDSAGRLVNRIFYKNGSKNGDGYFFAVKGEIRRDYFIDDEKVFDERMDVKLIPIQYRVYQKSGVVQYVVLFDSLGKKFYENGFIFEDSVQFLHSGKDSIRINFPTEIKIFTTQIPRYSREVRFDYFNHNNKKVNVVSEVINNDFSTTIKFTPNDVGKQTIVILGKLKDETGKIVRSDTLAETIFVK